MARPTSLDLTDLSDAGQRWRRVPMDGANVGIDVVPLASHPDDFVILARFPAGFERPVAGGYNAAETFLVLDGELQLNGTTVRRGDLTHVPAEIVRNGMSTAGGCTALAWFSGPATFLTPDELGECTLAVSTERVDDTTPTGAVLATPEAHWTLAAGAQGECVDVGLTRWTVEAAPAVGEGASLVRTRR
ncbi:hypothetical protein [Nocardioides yefusunii]|uniref:Cupin domain-containing protein n=1 Tax=Nocardioides yefusunii TaxID=2500546 RepID=A0ABW1QU61_9ACTN|nr:hypothetical protein [Nocardioides yefusunii]